MVGKMGGFGLVGVGWVFKGRLIIGADLFKQPAVQLREAKNLLQDFAHIPRAQRLLKVIGKELGK